MNCKNHQDIEAVGRCAGCQEPFCGDCLVEIKGQKYCGQCKVMTIQSVPQVEQATRPCKEASNALTIAIIGIFCFGIILGPVAIVKASKAKKLIADDPTLTGEGKATAAMIIGILVLVFGCWVSYLDSRTCK